LFFEAVRLVRELQPRAVVLENVAALLTRGLDRVLGTLAEIGYDAEWHCIPAAYVGAPHIRDRVFVLGYANSSRGTTRESSRKTARYGLSSCSASVDASSMADTTGNRWQQGRQDGRGGKEGASKGQECRSGGGGEASANANSEGLEKRQGQNAIGTGQEGRTELGRSEWWAVEPAVGRVANGIPRRVDRLRGLGNAVVPQVAELVGRMVVDILAKQSLQSPWHLLQCREPREGVTCKTC
jgi:DNA (cytosine-5)-methyltransferase 1